MQTKPLSRETQRIVDELRAVKEAVIVIHGPQANTAVLGRAISRLSYLDVDRERLLVWLEEERTKLARLEAGHEPGLSDPGPSPVLKPGRRPRRRKAEAGQ